MKSTALALALIGLSLPVFPAGMGKLNVMSGLGQPLRAEVELSVTREELSSLSAKVAPPEAFKQAGIEFAPVLTAIKLEIAKRPDGRAILRLSSDRPISEPFLDMLIQLDWAQGRLVREYTFLLDPPDAVFARQQVAPVVTPESRPAPVPARPAAAAAPAKADSAEPVKAPTVAAAATREVKRGDTLGRIAAETKPEGVTLDQMLVALFRANKSAFSGGNMNRLRSGVILNVPDGEAAAAVNAGEARKVVVAQAADFNAYRRRIAAAAAASAPAEAAAGQTATGKIAPRVEEKAPAAAEPKDQLRVSKADAKEQKEAQQRIASLEEDVATRAKALNEANSRLADLEKNVGELQTLVELKNRQLAELQKQATAAKPAPEPARPEPVAAAKPAPAPAAPEKPAADQVPPPAAPAAAPAAVAEEPKPAATAPVAEEAKPATPAPAEPTPPPVAAEQPKPRPAAPPAAEPGFFAGLMDNPLALFGGAGALAALLGLVGYRMRQGRKEELPPPSTVGKAGAQSVFGATGGQSVDTSASSIQTDFSHSGMTAIDADEGVDPVAEADVYMAYGRDAQAEEILLDALKNEPTRHAIHVKLLEIYAQRKNLKQFETLASELYAQTGGAGVEWEKAAAMGRKLDPANPLYGSRGRTEAAPAAHAAEIGAAGAAAAVAAGAGAAGIAAAAEAHQQFKDTWTMPGEIRAAAAEGGDSESTVAMPPGAVTSDAAAAGSFDLDLPRMEAVPAAQSVPEPAGLDFDLGLELSAPQSIQAAQSEVVRTGVLEPGIAERSEAAAAFAAESAEAERIGKGEAFAGTESLVARSIIDFDLGDAAEPVEMATAPAPKPDVPVMDLERTDVAGTLIDFNLDELTGSKPSGDVAVMDLERTDVGGNLLDFNFDLERGKQAPAQEAVPTLDLSGISLDLPATDAGALGQAAGDVGAEAENPEAATKLELAKAYEEMGDREGARELLDEVMAEGSVTQKEVARDILARMS